MQNFGQVYSKIELVLIIENPSNQSELYQLIHKNPKEEGWIELKSNHSLVNSIHPSLLANE